MSAVSAAVLVRVLQALLAAVPGRLREEPSPPFLARVVVDAAYVRARPEASAPAIGIVRAGDQLRVNTCTPACEVRGAWALVDGDGALRVSLLRPASSDDPPKVSDYVYGRVRGAGAEVRAAPERSARLLERRKAGEDLAFVPDEELLSRGWFRRARGGFVRAAQIRVASASEFRGELEPTLPLGFVVRHTGEHPRYERGAVSAITATSVQLGDEALPRQAVRVVQPRAVPTGVPTDARWVHVSLRRQTLVAYEGATPVFATLVSTGQPKHPTPPGLFRVWFKQAYAPMHGDPPESYFVDEVPFVQYFSKGLALHGTFWHDHFGGTASHGCVNLSMADAAWLFQWAPPSLPPGWYGIEPEPAQRQTLWVFIER